MSVATGLTSDSGAGVASGAGTRADASSGHPVLTPTLRQSAKRARFWLIVALVLLLAGVVGLLLTRVGLTNTDPLDSANPAPQGGMALAEVLRSQGVQVTAAASLDEAAAAAAASDPAATTVLLYDPNDYLDAAQLRQLGDLATRIVVLEPTGSALAELAPSVAFAGDPGTDSDDSEGSDAQPAGDASCELPAATRAGSVTFGSSSFDRLAGADGTDEASPASGLILCFPGEFDTFQLAQVSSAEKVVTVLASAEEFDNERIVRAGNAALALNLLGEAPSLIWYLPTVADVEADGPPSIADLTPGWLTPLILLLIVAAFAAAVWRGRRMGPLVVENLPVIVPSRETMEGRARLYQRSSARIRALDALRIGSVGRIASSLNLDRTATVQAVAAASAASTGWPLPRVAAILVDQLPESDRDLVRLSDDLDRLEQAVLASIRLGPGIGGTGGTIDNPATGRMDR